MTTERRHVERADVFFVVEFKPYNMTSEYSVGIVSNLSREGFNFESHDFSLKPSKTLEFTLKHPDNDWSLHAVGTIVWRRDGWYKCIRGIRITNVDAENRQKILEAVSFDKSKPREPVYCDKDSLEVMGNEEVNISAASVADSEETIHNAIQKLMGEDGQKRDKKEWYHALFDQATDCMLLMEVQPGESPVIIDANESACSMHGYKREELIGKPITFLQAPDSRKYEPGAVQSLLKGDALKFEALHMHKDTKIFPVLESAQLIEVEGKSYIVAVERDVTYDKKNEEIITERTGELKQIRKRLHAEIREREWIENSLKESDNRYRTLFDSVHSGAIVVEAISNGRNFIIRDINRSGEWIDKTRREAVVGKIITDVLPGVKEAGLFAVIRRVWKTGIPEYYRASQCNNKRVFYFRNNYLYKLPTGETTVVYDDITDLVRAEEKEMKYLEALKSISTTMPEFIDDNYGGVDKKLNGAEGEQKFAAFNMKGVPVVNIKKNFDLDLFRDASKAVMHRTSTVSTGSSRQRRYFIPVATVLLVVLMVIVAITFNSEQGIYSEDQRYVNKQSISLTDSINHDVVPPGILLGSMFGSETFDIRRINLPKTEQETLNTETNHTETKQAQTKQVQNSKPETPKLKKTVRRKIPLHKPKSSLKTKSDHPLQLNAGSQKEAITYDDLLDNNAGNQNTFDTGEASAFLEGGIYNRNQEDVPCNVGPPQSFKSQEKQLQVVTHQRCE